MATAEAGLIMGKRRRPKKTSTLYVDQGRIKRHILPLLGDKLVRDLSRADINKFIRDVANGKTASVEKTGKKRGKAIVQGGIGTASRTTGLLGGILSFAVSEGMIDTNPANGVKRPASNQRMRRLSPEEYSKLGKILLASTEQEALQSIAGAWLLALTGCRLNEIVRLRWEEIDTQGRCFRLADSKEGASIRPVGRPAFDILAKMGKIAGNPFILPAIRKEGTFGGMPKAWVRIANRADFHDVTPHTMRHSFASVAGDLGYSESTIAALLGHAAGSVTSRYVHHLDSVLLAAADKVAEKIYEMMLGGDRPPPDGSIRM